ncbi:MAG: PaaI family thioesterase [Alphaproteobacteria bacterium]|nr:PaaI family thioesterase [Alphaproteobacteria bacterium]
MSLQLDADGLRAFLGETFPQALRFGFVIDEVDDAGVTLRLPVDTRHLRPGQTVSGPTLMTLADTATYLAILSRVGPKALAVTTNLEIHFLRRPPEATLTARAELIKLGRTLAVATVTLRSDAVPEGPVGFATVTYSLPPDRAA